MQIGKDIGYSERILRFMRMCCLCGFCCSCFTEPEGPKHDEQWRSGGRGNEEYVPGQAAHKVISTSQPAICQLLTLGHQQCCLHTSAEHYASVLQCEPHDVAV